MSRHKYEGHAHEQPTRIGIIGAGPSGLTSAVELLDQGYRKVTIFERSAKAGDKSIVDKLAATLATFAPDFAMALGSYLTDNANANALFPQDRTDTVIIDDLGARGTVFRVPQATSKAFIDSGYATTHCCFAQISGAHEGRLGRPIQVVA